MRPTKRTIGDNPGQEITYENFSFRLPPPDHLKPSDKNVRTRFMRANPEACVIVKPDGKDDFEKARYVGEKERQLGNRVKDAWFEYFRFKAQEDFRWLGILMANEALLKKGVCIQFVCADPADFDPAYLPPQSARNRPYTKILNPFEEF